MRNKPKLSLVTINLTIIATLLFIIVPRARAAEITPDPTTYSYGSTSEFSQSKNVEIISQGKLANTGQNVYVLTGIIAVIVCAAGSLIIYRKRHYIYKKR